MNGIDILNSYDMIEYSWGYSPSGLGFAALTLVCCLFFIYCFKKRSLVASVPMVLLILFSVLTFSSFSRAQKETFTIYEVTISDDVKYTDFYDTYEVVEKRGEIYEIKLREKEDTQFLPVDEGE